MKQSPEEQRNYLLSKLMQAEEKMFSARVDNMILNANRPLTKEDDAAYRRNKDVHQYHNNIRHNIKDLLKFLDLLKAS